MDNMDDQAMDEAFDFSALSVDEPEDRLQKTMERALHLDVKQEQSNKQLGDLNSTMLQSREQDAESVAMNTADTTTMTEAPDNGPWAKLPLTSEKSPFLPGITAQKLDAMAMDPKHTFRSAQTPYPFPFSVPASSSASNSGSTNIAEKSDTDTSLSKGGESVEASENDKEKIPDWMLADPEMTPQPSGWSMTDTSGPGYTSKDFSLDWSDGVDRSTTVDANAIFGFSSYPTFESLPISNVIAEEQHRRNMAEWGDPSLSTSHLRDGGFSRFGNTAHGDGHLTPSFGSRDPDSTPTALPPTSISSSALPMDRTDSQQWQNWRAGPTNDHDIDLEMEEEVDELELALKSKIQITPGFAPAKFMPDCD
ncbi:hypothetical protein BG011_008957 [Mortierella polycephala]|uniref:Uncharacterized protein n=1 Tax=Mortierella polycephala TaxID=41804 RepID=A0A9P6Q9B3_9FUNG|nr:hypothetical protein BG011_008957 [Mortierella polycephala]